MGEFTMPSLGADMDEGVVAKWLVAPGDAVTRGDVVAEIETDKADIDVEVFESGVVGELLVEEGRRVSVGTPLATIVSADSSVPEPEPEPEPAAEPNPEQHEVLSPVIRRLARHLGVDIAAVDGSGPGGRITRHDVEAAAATATPPQAPAPAPAPKADKTTDRSASMRRSIAQLMATSKREIPHYYLQTDVDASAMVGWLDAHNAEAGPSDRILPTAVVVKALARAVVAVPELNGFWIDDGFVPGDGVHVGVAISLRGGGLVAPAILDADRRSISEVMAALADLVRRSRSGGLKASEMSSPTITLTALGEQGVDSVYGVIVPPQTAIVGAGRIRQVPWAADGMVGARPALTLTLAADHRATDGHIGSRLLQNVDRLLQTPEEL